jgi:uncharacterized delta-60 repeat protein
MLVACLVALAAPVAAYARPGDADTHFARNGVASADFGAFDEATALATRADGLIVVAGVSGSLYASSTSGSASGNLAVAVARYRADGTLDPSFGRGGKTRFSAGDIAAPAAVANARDGSVVLAITRDDSGAAADECCRSSMVVARLRRDGRLDATFGTKGLVDVLPPNQVASARAAGIAVQPDGKIVVAGTIGATADVPPGAARAVYDHTVGRVVVGRFFVARYDATGALDPTFGVGGRFLGGAGTPEQLGAMLMQPDGAIVLAGSATVAGASNVELVRLTRDGLLDATFGTAGIALAPARSGYASVFSAAWAHDGAILVGGVLTSFALIFLVEDPFIARFSATGAPDTRFGTAGVARVAAPNEGAVVALAAERSGRIVGALREGGCFLFGCSYGPSLFATTWRGRADNAAGHRGHIAFPATFANVRAVALHRGAPLVAGRTLKKNACAGIFACFFGPPAASYDLAIARLKA